MGTPLPPNQPANHCIVCWGVAKPFGLPPTPRVVKVKLSGLLPGQYADEADLDNLNCTHLLEQTHVPCLYNILDRIMSWNVNWNPANTTIGIFNFATVHAAFTSSIDEKCLLDMPNQLDGPDGNIAYAGTATITWDMEGLN